MLIGISFIELQYTAKHLFKKFTLKDKFTIYLIEFIAKRLTNCVTFYTPLSIVFPKDIVCTMFICYINIYGLDLLAFDRCIDIKSLIFIGDLW